MWWRHQLLAADITSFRASFYPHASANTHTATGSGPIFSLETCKLMTNWWFSYVLFAAYAGLHRLKQDLKQQRIHFSVWEFTGEGSTNLTFVLSVLGSCSQAVACDGPLASVLDGQGQEEAKMAAKLWKYQFIRVQFPHSSAREWVNELLRLF